MSKRIPIPEFDEHYINIYCPGGDVYKGTDTSSFKNSHYYEEWITNDFSVLKDGQKWHIVGITHPRPKGFINEFEFDLSDVHEAEYQLFHCCADGANFKDVFFEKSFRDCEKILYPQERPNEKPEVWAPHLMKYQDSFHIIYSPQEMRRVTSKDFNDWKMEPILFKCEDVEARDPYIFEENGSLYCLYTENGYIKYRISVNMKDWSDEKILQAPLFANCQTESPFLLKREGIYYLFLCVYDSRNSCYDNRTMVFAAETFDELFNSAPITMLKAHAPEIVVDSDGSCYLLSVYYPKNGISAVKLKWV